MRYPVIKRSIPFVLVMLMAFGSSAWAKNKNNKPDPAVDLLYCQSGQAYICASDGTLSCGPDGSADSCVKGKITYLYSDGTLGPCENFSDDLIMEYMQTCRLSPDAANLNRPPMAPKGGSVYQSGPYKVIVESPGLLPAANTVQPGNAGKP